MRFPFLLLLLLSPAFLWAQHHCGREAMVKDASWQLQRQLMELEIENFLLKNQASLQERNGPVTIPVVFHQLATDENDFLPDSYFASQLDILNEDFGNYSPNQDGTPFELKEIPVDMGIRFCHTTVDTFGQLTPVINRIETAYPCIGDIGSAIATDGRPRLFYSELGGADAWNTRFYLNIWVAPTCGSFLGFASFPMEALPAEDGVIVSTEYFGRRDASTSSYPYHLGRIGTHEVGHYFNLSHVWGEGGCDSDDFVADTPQQESFHRGCPVHPSNSCDSPDYFFNFMDYSDDECLSMFTYGQRERALSALYLYRAELLENADCRNWGPAPMESQWQLFPNPTVDLLYVVPPPSWPRPIPYSIYDAAGRLIQVGELRQNPLAIDTRPLGAGLYFLQLENGSEQITQPFLSFP